MSAATPTTDQVLKALGDLTDPETGRSLASGGQIREIEVREGSISAKLALTTYSAVLWKALEADAVEALRRSFPGVEKVRVERMAHERPAEKLGEIGLTAKSVIAVGSGKGGVGKSTLAAAIAFGLQRAGSRVGLMDADVYGPSVAHLIGVNQRPEIVDKKVQPIVADGVKVMSMGFLVPPGEAVVWRGPMLHGAITQFLRDTAWGELDYLILDMPPGTGDIALTLSQLLPLTGAVVVCTPQDVALLDAHKAIAMFRKVNIPVLGMVENMSYFIAPDTQKRYEIFGKAGGAQRRARELEVPFLGEVPINLQICVLGDEGHVGRMYDEPLVAPFLNDICQRMVRGISDARRANPPLPTLSVL
jgi:ATP-binding protein involved in chromosome partitioning